jgi:peptidyl-dipeptidase Dcp
MSRIPLLALAAAIALAACSRSAPPETTPTMADASSAPSTETVNPLLEASTLAFEAPPFDRIRDEHFAPAFDEGMRLHRAEVEAIAANAEAPTLDNTIVAMERSGDALTRVSKAFFHLSGAHTNDAIQAIEAEYAPKLAAHRDEILLDSRLFARIDTLHGARDTLGLDAESQRLLDRYHLMFVRAGARLDDAAKVRLKALNSEQAELQTRFQANVLKSTIDGAVVVSDRARLAGLDESAITGAADAARERGLDGQYLINLTNTTRQPVLASLEDRELRRQIWEASASRGLAGDSDNRAIVARLAAIRAELAGLLGYPNWAAYVLDDQMAKTPEAAGKLLADLLPAVVARTRAEAADIQALIDAGNGGFEVAAWDWEFYAEKVRRAKHDLDEAAIRPYFEFERVLKDGLFATMERQYGVRFVERNDLPVYHPDVRVFDVFEADGTPIGFFYADYFARPSKRGGAWMDAFVDQSHLLARKPVVVNVMSIPKAPAGQPTLLSYDDVKTMFHELGHGLHGLLSDARYPQLAGTSVPRDFVEFPSQYEEDWSLEPSVLAGYAKHHETGAPIPADLVAKIIDARGFNQGFDTLEYMAAALLDLDWHQLEPNAPLVEDVEGFERASLARHGVDLAAVPPRYRTTFFSHVWPGGYSAGYYAYLWAEILAADAFAHAMANGGLTRENGERYRRAILARGGTDEPMALYVGFRGQEPTVDALLKRRGLR